MLQNILQTTLALLALTTSFGILFHDTQVDRATAIALALPTATAITYAVLDGGVKSSESHNHVERANAPGGINGIRAMIPRTQPRDDNKRHAHAKLYYSAGGDNMSLWPSV